MAGLSALSWSGRSKVIVATRSATSYRIVSKSMRAVSRASTGRRWGSRGSGSLVRVAAAVAVEISRCKRLLSDPWTRNAVDDAVADERVLLERDESSGIARMTLNNAERRNCYDPE